MVELQRITKRFGAYTAVDGVDLHIQAGEFLTLLGPSGCGKTTLLRMISGFEVPCEGAVLLEGRDVTQHPPYRRDVNQVFQSYALFPHLNVRENIAFGLRMKKVPRAAREQRVQEAVELVSLAGKESQKPDQLSGGQKQRVALARALVCRPRVLLLDEPLSALDAKLRRSMQIELKRLQTRVGITFVFVTHDQEEALVMSDRIAVMNNGRIEQLGSAMEVYLSPATAFVADFLGQANVLEARQISRDADAVELLVCESISIRVNPRQIPEGQTVGFISIRPERIMLASEPATAANSLPVTIRERVYRGATAQVLIETQFGRPLNVVTSDMTLASQLQVGSRASATFEPADIVVLPQAG